MDTNFYHDWMNSLLESLWLWRCSSYYCNRIWISRSCLMSLSVDATLFVLRKRLRTDDCVCTMRKTTQCDERNVRGFAYSFWEIPPFRRDLFSRKCAETDCSSCFAWKLRRLLDLNSFFHVTLPKVSYTRESLFSLYIPEQFSLQKSYESSIFSIS